MAKTTAGFSLIELLAVLAIIVLSIGLVSLSINPGDQSSELKKQARDFANATSFIVEEAVLTNSLWGIDLYRDTIEGEELYGYRWLKHSEYGWLPDAPMDMAEGALFDSNIAPELVLESAEKLIEDKQEIKPAHLEKLTTLIEALANQTSQGIEQNVKNSELIPDIVISPGREVTPFVLTLRTVKDDQQQQIIRVDLIGRISLDKASDDELFE